MNFIYGSLGIKIRGRCPVDNDFLFLEFYKISRLEPKGFEMLRFFIGKSAIKWWSNGRLTNTLKHIKNGCRFKIENEDWKAIECWIEQYILKEKNYE